MPDSTLATAAPCPPYGILLCERGPGHSGCHRARVWSGRLYLWRDGCDESCTADCGACKGQLRRERADHSVTIERTEP